MKNYHHIKQVNRGWTKLPNAIRHDESLTSDAKVIIYELLSISGDFHISEAGIASSVNLSLERVKKAVKLLKATGYLEVSKIIDNSRFAGYSWTIADTKGTLRKCDFRETENQATENQSSENQASENQASENQASENQSSENIPIYKRPKGEQTNNERRIDEGRTDEGRTSTSSSTPSPVTTNPTTVVEDVEVYPSYNPSFNLQSSSVANAPSLSKNNTGGQVISQYDYLYQQFIRKYPKKPTGTDSSATKQAFFEIPDLENTFAEIMAGLDDWCNSVDWTKEGGRYITKPLNFITTRKWEEIPRSINTTIDPKILKSINNPDVEAYI